ncbi:MAG: helix-turn-helix transcriptional regulator [Sulfitobacter sp.]
MNDNNDDWFSPDVATFGDRVASAREAAGMTQTELSRRLGIRVPTLRSWENDLSEPRANRLSIMAGLLNVSMMWLINGQGQGLDAPDDRAIIPSSVQDILNEMRDLRADLAARTEQLARLEKRLRVLLKEHVDGGT